MEIRKEVKIKLTPKEVGLILIDHLNEQYPDSIIENVYFDLIDDKTSDDYGYPNKIVHEIRCVGKVKETI